MRICLVVHGFPPRERTGVEVHAAELAARLAANGHRVEVFAPRAEPELAHLALRREERPEGYAVSWLTLNHDAAAPRGPADELDPPGVAAAFGEFLDRERPRVVHFHHLVKLGPKLVDVARERSLPVVFTAHDYWGVCHRYTLLRPDLSRCDTIGDAEACARCDLVLGRLNAIPDVGDYQMGLPLDSLSERDRAAVLELLGGGGDAGAVAKATETRAALDRERLRALRSVDAILAPTRFLARALERGGLDGGRVRLQPYGIERDRFADVPPVSGRPGEPVRIAYFGGLSKQKGVAVLLDAFGRLQEPAELTLHGHGTDAAHVAELRAEAGRVGARWAGPYERDELPRLLGECDVVVVPSVWVENQPFVIREAFAAGRPVVASRLGALPESVEDGVDGLLFDPGDAADLAAVLTRLQREEGLLARLVAGISEVKGLGELAAELEELYAELGAGDEPEVPEGLPASVVGFARRRAQLERLPNRELFARVLHGIEELRHGLGAEAEQLPFEDLIGASLSTGSKAQVLLRDQRNEIAWTQRSLEDRADATRSLREEIQWNEDSLRARDETIASLEAQLAERDARESSLREELTWVRESLSTLEEEARWLRDLKDRMEADLEHRVHVEQRLVERLRQAARVGMAALRAQERVLGAELQPLVEILDRASHEPHPSSPVESAIDGTLDGLAHAIRRSIENGRVLERELARQRDELDWRRAEMSAARAAGERGSIKWLVSRTGLGRHVLSWEPDSGDDEAGGTAPGEDAP